MKRTILFIAVILLFSSFAPRAYAQTSGLSASREYAPYLDVKESDWYYEYVKLCYETNLMSGTGNSLFSPSDKVSLQQGIVITARLHRLCNGGQEQKTEPASSDWFLPSYEYCLKQGLLSESEYLPASLMTREMFARLLMRVFPETEFPQINEVKTIPGYDTSTETGQDVLTLYRAGVFSGTNKYGTFAPYSPISRAEIAALLCRIIRSDTRVAVSLEPVQDISAVSRAVALDTSGLKITGFDGSYIYASRTDAEGCIEYTVFDLNGKQILDWGKEHIGEASEGIFRVSNSVTSEISYYNTAGERLNTASCYAGTDFCDGFAAVEAKDGTISIIDLNGNVVRTLKNTGIHISADSLSGGYLQPTDRPNTLISIATGALVELPYSEISGFYNGTARVRRFSESGEFSANLIDTNLNELFSQDYTYINWGSDYFPVTNDNSNWGVADARGKLVVPMIYDSIQTNAAQVGLFSRLGSLSLRSMSTGEAILELPTGKDTEYQLCNDFIIRILSSREVSDKSGVPVLINAAYDVSVLDFDGYELLSLHNVPEHWIGGRSLLFSDGKSLYCCDISK